ncbi:MAG: GlsB/YeaQ/YmgE family stress response membrane protein [Acidobacteria bacterium]|nr:MAG: GlsB/YeaQ/YmgE family stress response membrane protein [Acidobacteriota bacterium]
MFSILGTIIVGLIVGVLARFLLPGRENFPPGATGILLTIVLGIAGAFVGTFVGRALGFGSADGELYAAGWIMSLLGAIVLLLLYRMIFGRGGTTVT